MTITIKKALKATCQLSTTSPGEDKLTTNYLRLAWLFLGERITNLFKKCIELRIHSRAFKKAMVIILPNSSKRYNSVPKFYRLILFLSCLDKELKRLIARRLSDWALNLK